MVGQKWSLSIEIEAFESRHCGYTAANPIDAGGAALSPNVTRGDKYLNLSIGSAKQSETATGLQYRLKIIIKDCSISSFLLLIY
jgi:hypothetical protein